MNYWIHRISHWAEVSHPLLANGYLTIGFSDFSNEKVLSTVLADDWHDFEQIVESTWGHKARTRFNLWRFLRMNKGDLVLVPSWKAFNVYRIKEQSPLFINNINIEDLKTWDGKDVTKSKGLLRAEGDRLVDLGFAWEVEPVETGISRGKYADAKLTSRLKIRQTNALVNDLKDSIEKSLANYKEKKPINIHSLIVEDFEKHVLATIRKELNPSKLEKLIRNYFLAIGANEANIPAKNEKGKKGDADVVAVFEGLKTIYSVQAKFQKNITNQWGVEQIRDYNTQKESIDDEYSRISWVITTADSFSPSAIKVASENKIQLIDGTRFARMILDGGISILDNIQ